MGKKAALHKCRPHTAGPIYRLELFAPPWLLVIGVSQSSLMVSAFRSKVLLALWEEETDPSTVRCGRSRLSCCLIVGIHASGILIPLPLLKLLGWSLMWITFLTLRRCQWGSRSINLTSSQSRWYPVLLACSETAEGLYSGVTIESFQMSGKHPDSLCKLHA